MKANGPKRKIFDAVDMLTEESSAHVQNQMADGVQMLPLEKIKAFHDHPFHLYEGERLDDMVESIKEHGVLTPVIVQKIKGGYEMLSGHNRANAAKLVGLTEIPAIVKESLTEQEAYVYVIETNMIQRSFNDLLPSEKAAVMAEQYDKTCCQGKRNDIIRELEILSGRSSSSSTFIIRSPIAISTSSAPKQVVRLDCGSKSTANTFIPRFFREYARLNTDTDFPTPPFMAPII